jgi:hypothetical protein
MKAKLVRQIYPLGRLIEDRDSVPPHAGQSNDEQEPLADNPEGEDCFDFWEREDDDGPLAFD